MKTRRTATSGRKRAAKTKTSRTKSRRKAKKTVAKPTRAKVKKTAKATSRRRLTAPSLAGLWLGNDLYDSCAVVAVANSLLAATGIRPAGTDLLDLYLAAAGGRDDGATIADVLAAATDLGVAGIRPVTFRLLEPGESLDAGMVLGVTLTRAQQSQPVWDAADAAVWGPHAVTITPAGVATWGTVIPVTGRWLETCDEAWQITWPAL